MCRTPTPAWLLFALCACGAESREATAPAARPEPSSQPAAQPAPTVAPSAPGSDPCANPGPVTLELEAGVIEKTPWDLEITYALEEDKKRGDSYVFLLRSGTRRWEARRNDSNWTAKLTWRGFCWRGGQRPERRASKLQIEMAPVCKDGKLVEMGGCGDALGPG